MFFFFQAEDGIRDGHVTGVQTCALPISSGLSASSVARVSGTRASPSTAAPSSMWKVPRFMAGEPMKPATNTLAGLSYKIGRASCRERGESGEGSGRSKRKTGYLDGTKRVE